MDIIDDAAVATEQFIGEAIQKVRRALAAGPSAAECDECGAEISYERRIAVPGCRLCVQCKQMAERGRLVLARA